MLQDFITEMLLKSITKVKSKYFTLQRIIFLLRQFSCLPDQKSILQAAALTAFLLRTKVLKAALLQLRLSLAGLAAFSLDQRLQLEFWLLDFIRSNSKRLGAQSPSLFFIFLSINLNFRIPIYNTTLLRVVILERIWEILSEFPTFVQKTFQTHSL